MHNGILWKDLKGELPNFDFSMRGLSREIGISPTYLLHMLDGKVKVTAKVARDIERVLQIEISDRPIDLEEKFLDVCRERDMYKTLLGEALQCVQEQEQNEPPFIEHVWHGQVPGAISMYLDYGSDDVRHWPTPTREGEAS